jgi:hypothetical protein
MKWSNNHDMTKAGVLIPLLFFSAFIRLSTLQMEPLGMELFPFYQLSMVSLRPKASGGLYHIGVFNKCLGG